MGYLFILAVIIILLALWYMGYKRGLSLKDILLWSLPRPKRELAEEDKNDGDRNGTQKDVAVLVNRLLAFANKKKIRQVIPGMIRYDGIDTNISAILVGHGEVLGIICMGFGGRISADQKAQQWQQELNGEVKMFPNPLKNCADVQNIMETALREQDIRARCSVVPVFTTPGVVFTTVPQGVYTVDSLFYTLDDAMWVTEGNLDINRIADALSAMVPVNELRAAAKNKPERRRSGKKVAS